MFSTKLLIAALAFAGSQATRLEVSDGHRKDYHGKGLAQIEDKGCDAWFAWNCDGWGDEIFFSQIDSQRKGLDDVGGRGHMKKP